MLDLGLAATMVVVCAAIGYPLTELLPRRLAWRSALAPVLGFAVLAVIVPVAYRHGMTLGGLFRASLALAAVLLVVRARAITRTVTSLSGVERRHALLVLGGYLMCLLVLLAPRWTGGDQFAVFQGNQ